MTDRFASLHLLCYIIALCLFWASVGALFYTYVIYPFIIWILAGRKKLVGPVYLEHELPVVSILIPAHNEESVIEKKISSIYSSNYPQERIEVIVGSDASTDRTDEIVLSLKKSHEQLGLVRMNERSGKATVLNCLVGRAKGEVIILTDANILFEKNTLYELVKHFKDQDIGLIDTNMQHTGIKQSGISIPEKTYLRGEVALKHKEGLLWGVMMGPFGGCYAMRKKIYSTIPRDCMADDFYVCMSVLRKGHHAISQLSAIVYEDISNEIRDEFRRRVRIATGCFQNLAYFYPILLRLNALSFALFSHKVLRWFGPLFIIIICLLSVPLMKTSPVYVGFVVLEIAALVLLLTDLLLKRVDVHFSAARLLTHFVTTNAAMFVGMIRFLSGKNTGIWTPTRRHQ